MKRARLLPIFLLVLGLSGPIDGEQPDKSSDRVFTLGTPEYIREKKSDDTFTIVVPVQVQKSEQFETPGLKIAYVIFDKTIKSPPRDLKSVDNSYVLKTDKNGERDLVWQVRSVKEEIAGQAHFYMGRPQYKAVDKKAVMKISLRGLPDKDIGLFIIENMQPGSNVLILRKNDFVAGDGDAVYQAAVAKIPAAGP